MDIVLYDKHGQIARCIQCGQPATALVNLAIAAASSVPSNMQPVCEVHALQVVTPGTPRQPAAGVVTPGEGEE